MDSGRVAVVSRVVQRLLSGVKNALRTLLRYQRMPLTNLKGAVPLANGVTQANDGSTQTSVPGMTTGDPSAPHSVSSGTVPGAQGSTGATSVPAPLTGTVVPIVHTGAVLGGAVPPVNIFENILTGRLSVAWAEWMRSQPSVLQAPARMAGCTSSQQSGLSLNQLSVIAYVSAEIARWKARQQMQGRTLHPPERGGLMLCHSVGAGKTTTMLGIAREVRRVWPACTVIVAADTAVYKNLQRTLPVEAQRRFGVGQGDRLRKTQLKLGPNHENEYWQPTGYSLDHLTGVKNADGTTGAALLDIGVNVKAALVDTNVKATNEAARSLLPRLRYRGRGGMNDAEQAAMMQSLMGNTALSKSYGKTYTGYDPGYDRDGPSDNYDNRNDSYDDDNFIVHDESPVDDPDVNPKSSAKGNANDKTKAKAKAKVGAKVGANKSANDDSYDQFLNWQKYQDYKKQKTQKKPKKPKTSIQNNANKSSGYGSNSHKTYQHSSKYQFTNAPVPSSSTRKARVNVRSKKARKWPRGPVVLIIDEAHQLAAQRTSTTAYSNYAALSMFLQDRVESSNVYRVLATATPADRTHTANILCSMVVPDRPDIYETVHRVCTGGPHTTPVDYSNFVRYMQGCVDVYTTLGDPNVYPQLRVSGRNNPSPYYQSPVSSITFVRQVCVNPARPDKHSAELLANTLSIGSPRNIAATITNALKALRSTSTKERENAAKLIGTAIYFSFFDRDRPEKSSNTLRDKVRKATRESAAAIRHMAAQNIHPAQHPTPLWNLSPKLAMFAWQLLLTNNGQNDISPRHGFPQCKQLVIIPLSREVQKYCHLSDLAEDVIQNLTEPSLRRCTMADLPRADSAPCYLNIGHGYRQGDGGTPWVQYVVSALRAEQGGKHEVAPFVYNSRANLNGERVPIVIATSSAYAESYNLMAVQRVHVLAIGDTSTVAQALGRVQRPRAMCDLPPHKHTVDVCFYAECDAGDVELRHDVLQAIVDQSQGVPAERVVAHTLRAIRKVAVGAPPTGSEWAVQLAPFVERAVQSHDAGVATVTAEDIALANHIAGNVGAVPERLAKVAYAVAPAAQALPVGASTTAVLQTIAQKLSPLIYAYAADQTRMVPAWRDQLRSDVAWAQRSADVVSATADVGRDGFISIDSALAIGHCAIYTPVLRLVESLYAASVSCVLYGDALARYGQEAGMPVANGIPQRVRCGQPPQRAAEIDAVQIMTDAPNHVGATPYDAAVVTAVQRARDTVCTTSPQGETCTELQKLALHGHS